MSQFFQILIGVISLSMPIRIHAEESFGQVESKLDYSNVGCSIRITPALATQLTPSMLAWGMISGHYFLTEKASRGYYPSLYGASFGIGARYLLMPQWALGLHVYHDRASFKITTPHATSSFPRGTDVFGIESLWPFCRAYFNFYRPYKYGWNTDFKLSIPISPRVSIWGGATFGLSDSNADRPGFALGAKCHFDRHWHFEAQYTNNDFNEYYWAISLQKVLGTDIKNPRSLLHQSIERNFANPLLLGAIELDERITIEGTRARSRESIRDSQFLLNRVFPQFPLAELTKTIEPFWEATDTNYQTRLSHLLDSLTGKISSKTQSCELYKLPNELLHEIIDYLPIIGNTRLPFVSTRIYQVVKTNIETRLIHSYRTKNMTLAHLVREIQINPFALKPKYMLMEPQFSDYIKIKNIIDKGFSYHRNPALVLAILSNKERNRAILAELGTALAATMSQNDRVRHQGRRHRHMIFSVKAPQVMCYFPEFYSLLDFSNINTLVQLASLNHEYYSQSKPMDQTVYCPINIAALIFRNKALYQPILQLPDIRYPLYYLSMMALNSAPQTIMYELRYDETDETSITVLDFIKKNYTSLAPQEKNMLFKPGKIQNSLNLLGDFLETIEDYPTAFSLNQLIEQSQKTGAPLKWNYPESLERVAVREQCSWRLSWENPCSLEEFKESIQIHH